MFEYWYQNEIRKLEIYHKICSKAVSFYAKKTDFELTDFEKDKIIEILDRVFINELDFLQNYSKVYYSLYR
jgi:hypothetical protein